MMETYRKEDIRRGDIYYADLRPVVGSEQGGIRPVVILQNNVGNRHSPTVIAAAITSRKGKHKLPRVLQDHQGTGDQTGTYGRWQNSCPQFVHHVRHSGQPTAPVVAHGTPSARGKECVHP
jgi:mRNA-degrading endonuclease toxin of MazEF toxin-antitoxin module